MCRLAAALMIAMFFQSCDLPNARPATIQHKFEDSLRHYFVHAQVAVDPDRAEIVAFACDPNAGPALIEQVRRFLVSDPDIQRLRTLRDWAPLIWARSYANVSIVFPQQTVVLAVDSWQATTQPTNPDLQRRYAHTCPAP